MLMRGIKIIQKDDYLYVACPNDGKILNQNWPKAECWCGYVIEMPKAVWLNTNSRASLLVPAEADNYILVGWVASWLDVPIREVEVEVE